MIKVERIIDEYVASRERERASSARSFPYARLFFNAKFYYARLRTLFAKYRDAFYALNPLDETSF